MVAILVGICAPRGEPRAADRDTKQTADAPSKGEPNPSAEAATEEGVVKELFAGQVVLLTDALKRRGIQSKEEMKGQVVLETAKGELWPIVSDWRGRAFFQDERLRNRKVELIARRHAGVPYLQVLTIFTFNDKGERQLTDYWCDVCAIPMYELKDCECCQGPIRLRFQPRELPRDVKPAPDSGTAK